MSTSDIESLRSDALAQLADLLDNPQPTVTVNGQELAWSYWLKHLQQTVDWCDGKLQEYDAFEIRSEGST